MAQLYILKDLNGWPAALVEEIKRTPKRIYVTVIDKRDQSKWVWLRSLEGNHEKYAPRGLHSPLVPISDPACWYRNLDDLRAMHARWRENQGVLDMEFVDIKRAHNAHCSDMRYRAVADAWERMNVESGI